MLYTISVINIRGSLCSPKSQSGKQFPKRNFRLNGFLKLSLSHVSLPASGKDLDVCDGEAVLIDILTAA